MHQHNREKGLFIVFESAPKCGKTTLAALLTQRLSKRLPKRTVMNNRGALSASSFAKSLRIPAIMDDVAYSTGFFWSDIIFDTKDKIQPALKAGAIVIQDRYDLSILTYRELNGFSHDHLLLKEYIDREMLITPDLTVFLNPQRKVAYRRMLEADDTSDLDRAFFERRGAFQLIQERYEHHLKRLRRPHFVLDTGKKIDHCIEAIIQQIDSCQQT